MAVTWLGVRHHSPACARLVAETIDALRPAYVLVEGPVDVNDRLGELLLPHTLPVAVFSYHRGGGRSHLSWTPFCEYSPEWVALTAGRAAGAEVRFIDLPAWHSALADRSNRYADAEQRYTDVVARLCESFGVDNVDTLWDHLVEAEPGAGLAERLATYFDLLRGESAADEADAAREEYMARWVRAAMAEAGDRPIVVVSGGFHRPALRTLSTQDSDGTGWPEVPRPQDGAIADSYLVPYSFKRLDAFDGYQSGMPSPEYYQQLWESGLEGAADALVQAVVSRLRHRKQAVSTADLVAARALTEGLARLRGHQHPARTDVLDGLVSALVSDALDRPLPWTRRGPLAPGAHPVVVEMVAAFSGNRVGRLHPGTPTPPLVHEVTAELERLGLDRDGQFDLDLTKDRDLVRSRALHCLRALGVPGLTRDSGPLTGADPVLRERWTSTPSDLRLPALIEAAVYGATLADAATAVLDERFADAESDIGLLAGVLFDAVLCGITELSERVIVTVAEVIAGSSDLAALGEVLATTLGLWRHDRLFGTARSPVLGAVITASVTRVLWLAEAVRGGPAPANPARLRALAATRDALLHADTALGLDRAAALAVATRVGADTETPPDLRGAAYGLSWSLGAQGDPARAVLGMAGPKTLGDWLAGLFALARDEVLADENGVLAVLDRLVTEMTEQDFLLSLPALRAAFEFFPPRERETIARGLLDRRGMRGSARSLLRTNLDPLVLAEAAALEEQVGAVLAREGLEIR
ncbi:DUF5682 family protein [Allokutzneria multivorans]|uniref:DUF5682 family protein n=1 Tax=Allokutzneria multivorans TaxID=1142134 RepID=A0ABP7SEJ7_9PSEU